MEMKFGNFTAETPSASTERLSLLLWGSSGCGKTTLASTAPGKKLWLSFDPDATQSIYGRDDFMFINMAKEKPRDVVEEFKAESKCLQLDRLLKESPDLFDTLVVDSITSFKEIAYPYAIAVAQSTAKGKSSTIEDPGYAGYGNLNTWVRQLVDNLLRVTARHNKNIIFICHEDKPSTNDDGAVMFITIMLGGSLSEQVPVKISETWWLSDDGKQRKIAVRPCRQRKPMKTRMFDATSASEFVWRYDALTRTGDGIEQWFNSWLSAGTKIPLPK